MNPVEQFLQNNQIEYTRHEHPPLYTTKDADKFGINVPGLDCKNLFLVDKKSGRHFLVILPGVKRADLKQFAQLVGIKRVSFANAEALQNKLGLEPGSVSPFGLINDPQQKVEFYLDQEVYDADRVNFHPNINTASLEVSQAMFHKYLDSVAHKINIIKL